MTNHTAPGEQENPPPSDCHTGDLLTGTIGPTIQFKDSPTLVTPTPAVGLPFRDGGRVLWLTDLTNPTIWRQGVAVTWRCPAPTPLPSITIPGELVQMARTARRAGSGFGLVIDAILAAADKATP